MEGKVKSFDWKSGYGFLVDKEGKEYFIGRQNMPQEVYVGNLVEFSSNTGEKGLFATDIQLKNKGAWIEYGGKIFETLYETETEVIAREILYLSENPKLKYGEKQVISKTLIKEGQNDA